MLVQRSRHNKDFLGRQEPIKGILSEFIKDLSILSHLDGLLAVSYRNLQKEKMRTLCEISRFPGFVVLIVASENPMRKALCHQNTTLSKIYKNVLHMD